MPNRVEGQGSVQPKLIIVGAYPGRKEDEMGIPFVGETGELLNEILFKCGLSRSEVYITNVVKYRPPAFGPDDDLEAKFALIGVSLSKSIEELWEFELKPFHPNCILAMGDLAFEACTGLKGSIFDYRGSILKGRDGTTKCVPTIHLAALLHNEGPNALPWTYYKLIEADIHRAVEESVSRELNLPDRALTIAHNSLDVHRYFQEYKHLDKAVVDIESHNCVPTCIGFAFNKHHALSIPLLRKIGSVVLTDMGDTGMNECWREIDIQLRRLKLIGHHLKYDEFKLGLIGFETPNIYSDTLIKARVIFPELPDKRLCTLSSLWTREPFYKDDGKEFKFGKHNIENLLIYNGRDCAVNYEVDEVTDEDLLSMGIHFGVPMMDYYRQQMRKHKFYLKLERNGKRVDLEKQLELRKEYTEMQMNVHNKLVAAVGHEINVKSYPQMFTLLYNEMKFKVLKKDPTSEDAIVRLMANHAKKAGHKEILEMVLEERRIRDQKSRYINFSPDYDGRCKSYYNIIATETCRSSTGILKKPMRPKKIGLADHTVAKHGRLAKDIQSMFIADEGMVIIQADASQAEARVVAVLAKDWELLKAFDEIDIHRRTAGLIFGFSRELELSKDYVNAIIDALEKDGPERFCGKKTRHAGNYDMKKSRFMVEFNTDAQKFGIPMSISEWKAGQMLDLFHAASPKTKEIFHAEIQEALRSTRVLIDPYGGPRVFNGKMDEQTYKEGYANIPQRTVAHLVQGAALSIDDELGGDTSVMWATEKHDALYLQAPVNNWEPYAKLMQKHMQTPIDFSTYCTLKRDIKLIIPCDIEISHTNYASFEKVKLAA